MSSDQSLTYILRRNAFRDNSLILDCFSESSGRITIISRYSKRQGNRIKGMLEPFRLLDLRWSGRGDVYTLFSVEEKRRYALKGGALIQATYLNELMLRLFQPHQSVPELFSRYRQVLHLLQSGTDMPLLMQFELEVLAVCGYELNLWHDDLTQEDLQPGWNYYFQPDRGLLPLQTISGDGPEYSDVQQGQRGVLISGELLIALRYPEVMQAVQWQELRGVLDRLLALLLNGKILYARQLLGDD